MGIVQLYLLMVRLGLGRLILWLEKKRYLIGKCISKMKDKGLFRGLSNSYGGKLDKKTIHMQ